MGRGRSKNGSGTLVDYDKWGKRLTADDIKNIYDKNGDIVGYIEDEVRYITEPDIRKITKKEILDDVDGWRDDNGFYGDDDTAIYFAYKDGSFVDAADLDGKRYKKTGLVGVSVSTGDYEMVWGGEVNKRTGEISKWKTTEFDDNGNNIEGHTDSYYGYKAIGQYMVRVKTMFNVPNGKGGYKVERTIIRKSKNKMYKES